MGTLFAADTEATLVEVGAVLAEEDSPGGDGMQRWPCTHGLGGLMAITEVKVSHKLKAQPRTWGVSLPQAGWAQLSAPSEGWDFKLLEDPEGV